MDSSLSPAPLDMRSSSANRLRSIPTYKKSKENTETHIYISRIYRVAQKLISCAFKSTIVYIIMITWTDVKTFHCHVVLAHLTAKKLFHIGRELEWTLDSGKSKVLIYIVTCDSLQYTLDWQTWDGRCPHFVLPPPLSTSVLCFTGT